jgi:hypothetical protein
VTEIVFAEPTTTAWCLMSVLIEGSQYFPEWSSVLQPLSPLFGFFYSFCYLFASTRRISRHSLYYASARYEPCALTILSRTIWLSLIIGQQTCGKLLLLLPIYLVSAFFFKSKMHTGP